MTESPQNREQPVPENAADKVFVQAAQWAGPLPPPAALEHFERVIPGGAERILRMAEIEQGHRIKTMLAIIHPRPSRRLVLTTD